MKFQKNLMPHIMEYMENLIKAEKFVIEHASPLKHSKTILQQEKGLHLIFISCLNYLCHATKRLKQNKGKYYDEIFGDQMVVTGEGFKVSSIVKVRGSNNIPLYIPWIHTSNYRKLRPNLSCSCTKFNYIEFGFKVVKLLTSL